MDLNFASPAVAHVTWLNPTQRFELLLRQDIARIENSWKKATQRKTKPRPKK